MGGVRRISRPPPDPNHTPRPRAFVTPRYPFLPRGIYGDVTQLGYVRGGRRGEEDRVGLWVEQYSLAVADLYRLVAQKDLNGANIVLSTLALMREGL